MVVMASISIGQMPTDRDFDLSNNQKQQRSLEHHQPKDATAPKEANIVARPNVWNGPLGSAQQSSRKLEPALHRLKESFVSCRVDDLKTRLAIDDEHGGAMISLGMRCRVRTPAKGADVIISTLQQLDYHDAVRRAWLHVEESGRHAGLSSTLLWKSERSKRR